ncbi:MAG TPA: hypothetical protein VLX67_05175 [Stellaceae bacterium]|nr:hypothetical protein [Stellaceae bacterium]
MGIGYAVSPLHRMIFIDRAAIPESADARSVLPIPRGFRATPWSEIEKHLYSPAIPDVVAWRAKLSEKYRSQLLEPLIWDERSAFETSEEVSTHADALLRYVAALLDRQGAAEAAQVLFGRDDVPGEDIQREYAAAAGRGFAGAFPQLLLDTMFWFPFERDFIIEEPDWEGRVERFGSAGHLVQELKKIRNFIRHAEPSATGWTSDRNDPPTVLGQVWRCSETIYRLAVTATRRRLPLWTTG